MIRALDRPALLVTSQGAGATSGTSPPAAGAQRARRWVENRPTRGLWPRLQPRELWAYRDVGLILAERDVKVRYKQTFFGVAWALLQPLSAMGIFTLVLGEGAGIESQGVPYAAFALVGLAVWFPFNTGITSAAESLVRDPELVTKVYFPRLLAPLGAVLASAIDLAMSLAIAQAVALIAGIPLQASLVVIPACFLAVVLLTLAFGVWLSALNVLYRDVRYALGFATQVLFFASPIVYPSSLVPGGWQSVLAINPVVGLVEVVRWSMLGVSASRTDMLVSLGSGILVLVSGLAFFRRVERHFADRI
jgi:lipopolysaccharide transport system permease protein